MFRRGLRKPGFVLSPEFSSPSGYRGVPGILRKEYQMLFQKTRDKLTQPVRDVGSIAAMALVISLVAFLMALAARYGSGG